MTVLEVKDKSAAREFLNLPRRLYKDDPDWICPLDNDITAVFDPQRNSFFTHGSCTRWILKNELGETIGRVAAFINKHKAYEEEQPTGGMGFLIASMTSPPPTCFLIQPKTG